MCTDITPVTLTSSHKPHICPVTQTKGQSQIVFNSCCVCLRIADDSQMQSPALLSPQFAN